VSNPASNLPLLSADPDPFGGVGCISGRLR
jgi:hypothetical protein